MGIGQSLPSSEVLCPQSAEVAGWITSSSHIISLLQHLLLLHHFICSRLMLFPSWFILLDRSTAGVNLCSSIDFNNQLNPSQDLALYACYCLPVIVLPEFTICSLFPNFKMVPIVLEYFTRQDYVFLFFLSLPFLIWITFSESSQSFLSIENVSSVLNRSLHSIDLVSSFLPFPRQ